MIQNILPAALPRLFEDPSVRSIDLVGMHGNLSRIVGAIEDSNMVFGAVAIETEHGTVYIDSEEQISVSVENVSHQPTGRWMQTYTGRKFFPMQPQVDDIDITDIAHALGNLCRYNGHVDRFYSVAQHCVLVSEHVDAEHALWGLLHDAGEAYVGDMVSPLKVNMPHFVTAENAVLAAIAERFSLPVQMPQQVHEIDRRLRADEAMSLLGPAPTTWFDPDDAIGVTIEPWGPELAAKRYLERFMELTREVRRVSRSS